MDSETARFVARRGYDASLISPAADNHGEATEFWAREQFDGDKESVHIDMKDSAIRGQTVGRIVLGTKLSQLGHWRYGLNYSVAGEYPSARVLLEADARVVIRGGGRGKQDDACLWAPGFLGLANQSLADPGALMRNANSQIG